MKRYVIERDLPGVGTMNRAQFKDVATTSNNALANTCVNSLPEDQDRSVVHSRPGEEHDAQAIIGAVGGLGASLDKRVVAEGIETEEQMRQVKAHGCHEGQGHFFGEPMPAEIIRARLAESTSVAQLVA